MSTTNRKNDFTMIPNHVIEAGLTPQALALFVIIAKHADNNTDEGWPSRKGMATLMGMSKPASVDRYITELEKAGFISKTYQRKADGSQGSNLYRITAWDSGKTLAESPTRDGGSPLEGTGVVPHSGHELDPVNYTQLTRPTSSVQSPPEVATEEMAEEKEESAASLAFLDDPRFHSIYTVALQHVNPSLDPLEAQERAHSIAVERFRDVQMQDEKILEAQRRNQARWDSLPKWVTPDHRKAAEEKNIDLPAKVAELVSRGSQVRVPGALLSTILRDEKPVPVQVGPVHQCD